ncbi:protein kinase domain-containing protein [Rubrivirga sp. IMCC43871]|uniref:protein kinase domain-containing protein n=1 Tax=Rubrivirga sp. IMCC43871 TaxID=3391575 RepID=UPI00398FF3E1
MTAPDPTRAADLWRQAQRLLPEALDRPPAERPAFLDAACADDDALRAELDALLGAHDQADGFLDALDADHAAALLGEADTLTGQSVGPYRIERELGRGGMGVVYLAHDPRLDRPVALKLISPHLSADAGARRRLVAEAKAAAALDHPAVAAVHEIGQADDGRLYIAMAYVEGPSLRERLEGGPLPVAEAVAVARRLAEGLGAAHRAGVVHRDVKPSNVLLAAGGARLVDFGIAKAAGRDLTREGATLGTVAYMSPERTRGEPADARADLWSWGVVLYEMLTGERPFRGETDATRIHAIRHDDPAPVRALRPDVPTPLAAVVDRCLAKEPGRRFPDADAVLAALDTPKPRRRWVGALALAAAVVAGAVLWPRPTAPDPPPGDLRIAVLPFADDGAGPDDAYLADGLTEALIARLSTVGGLRVIARSSSERFRDSEASAETIGRELGAGALLTGRVQRSDASVRVAVELVDAASGEVRWADMVDADRGDVLGVQPAIAARVAAALGVTLRADERRRLATRGTDDAVAYDHYLKGRHLLHTWAPEPLVAARDHFQRALDRDPTFADAWAGLADAAVIFGYLGLLTAPEAAARGQAAAERALALDDESAGAHNALASVLANDPHAWPAAEAHFRRALALDPSDALAHLSYAELLRDQGRFDAALAEIAAAQTLDPLSPYARLIEGIILWFASRPDDALAVLRRIERVHGPYPAADLFAGLVLLGTGDYRESLAALDRADPERADPDALSTRARALAGLGRRAEARAVLAELEALADDRYVSPFLRAVVHDALGETDRVFPLLEQAHAERSWFVRMMRVGPVFEGLRADPRYQALLVEVGLAE